MFGLVDRFFAKKWNKSPIKRDWNWGPRITGNDSEEVWYCFIPSQVMNSDSLRSRLVPKAGKIIVYTTSFRNMISSDTQRTIKIFQDIYHDAKKRMLADLKEKKKINLLGISLGSFFSVRLAHDIPGGKINSLISIVGGSHPGKAAWDSIATSGVVRDSKHETAEDYEKVFAEFSPLIYFQGIRAEKILARFGRFDSIIPYQPYGKELRDALKGMNASYKDIKTYWWVGHVTSIFLSSKEKIYDKLRKVRRAK